MTASSKYGPTFMTLLMTFAVLTVPAFFIVNYYLLKHALASWTTTLLVFSCTSVSSVIMSVAMTVVAIVGCYLEQWKVDSGLRHRVRTLFYTLVRIHSKVFYGYTIHGLENLMKAEAGLVVFYHMLIPVDLAVVMAELYRKTGRILGGVSHRDLFHTRNYFLEYMNCSCKKEDFVNALKQGQLRAVAPGGERETLFSRNYSIEFGGRTGFAKIAKELKVPVYPLFTANSREAMPFATFGFHDALLRLYEDTRYGFFFPLIMFPVKLRIYIGEALYCRDEETPAEFAARVKKAIEHLRDTHQRKPASFLAAFLERFD